MTARPIRYQRQVSDRKGKIFYTSITSLSHISKGGRDIPQNLITLCSDCHALVHGFNAHDYPDMTPESVEQAIVEYLADYYAPDWYPWEE